jgi:hypothetical protein
VNYNTMRDNVNMQTLNYSARVGGFAADAFNERSDMEKRRGGAKVI